MSEPWWSDNYDGPCQWADRDPSNKPWCELHQSWGSIDAHACWFAALTDRAEKAEAQVQRVRELLAHPRDYRGNGSEWNECRDAVLRALGRRQR